MAENLAFRRLYQQKGYIHPPLTDSALRVARFKSFGVVGGRNPWLIAELYDSLDTDSGRHEAYSLTGEMQVGVGTTAFQNSRSPLQIMAQSNREALLEVTAWHFTSTRHLVMVDLDNVLRIVMSK